LAGLLTTGLDARQRAAVIAVCTDMHQPDINAVTRDLAQAEIVFDKFHVQQHASAALDEVRRQEFFRAGAVMRAFGRGKRWLLLRRWKTVRGSKRTELQQLFAANHRLFKAYVLREQLDRLWTYKTRDGVARFLFGWLKALRWQRLPEIEKLGDTLVNHFDGIAAYCDHPVCFGVVESLNTTIKGVLRRARGMRDEAMLCSNSSGPLHDGFARRVIRLVSYSLGRCTQSGEDRKFRSSGRHVLHRMAALAVVAI
jgi:transposase